MVSLKRRLASPACAGFAAIGVLLFTAAPAWPADPVAEFYSGKTIKVLVGFGTGGGYDVYARTIYGARASISVGVLGNVEFWKKPPAKSAASAWPM